MTDIEIFPFSPHEMIKMESVALDCNQLNQIDLHSNLISENSSQASSGEVETEPENKTDECSIDVTDNNDQQNNSYQIFMNDIINNNSTVYNNKNIEINSYDCSTNYHHESNSAFYNNNNHNFSNIPWSIEEDEIIKDYIKKDQKISKSQIKDDVPNIWARLANVPLLLHNKRAAKDIKQRWMLHLDPFAEEERLKGPWTIEEDILLAKLHDIYGNCWNKIASFIPGRTEPSVKNRWNSHLKNKLRSRLESQESSLSKSTIISTPSKLLNSLFQNEKQSATNDNPKSKKKSDSLQSTCQYLIIDDLDKNYISNDFILDDEDHSALLEFPKKHKNAEYGKENDYNSYHPVKSNNTNKEKSIFLDCRMPPQIKSPNLNSPFTFFGPWPNVYYSSA